MTNSFLCEDKQRLVDYLYGEVGDRERAELDAHVEQCRACADELAGLRGVRSHLLAWQPPEADLGFRVVRQPVAAARPWWHVPVWAPMALAAGLLLAVGAAVANVEVEYGRGTVIVRSAWSHAIAPAGATSAAVPAAAASQPGGRVMPVRSGMSEADVRAALGDLERRLRSELGARPAVAATAAAVAPSNDRGALLQQVQTLIDESERRQQRELALRLSQLVQDVDSQRRADLVRIEQGFGQIEGLTGQEAARQRAMINYLMRTSLQK